MGNLPKGDRRAIALSADLEIVECDRVASGVHIAFLGEERYAKGTLRDRAISLKKLTLFLSE
jgi:hypothetical protein